MLAAVQPDRLLLGQRGADRAGADGALRQVDADAPDVARIAARVVGAVGQHAEVDHDALGIGEHGEIAGVGDGARQAFDHRTRGRHQGAVALHHLALDAAAHGLEAHALLRLLAGLDAALPRAGDPGFDAAAGRNAEIGGIAMDQGLSGLGDGQRALGCRQGVGSEHLVCGARGTPVLGTCRTASCFILRISGPRRKRRGFCLG